MAPIVGRILATTAKNLTVGGLENFKGDKKYLIITNHRDIVLDSAIIQLLLYKNNIKTTWLAQGYFNDYFHSDVLNIEAIENYLDKISKYSPNTCLLPIGADHLGILKNAKQKIEKVNKKLKNYEIILTSPFEYFKNEQFENDTNEIEFLDNSHTYILQGVYSARIPQKIRNVDIQNRLSRIVEPLNYFLKDEYEKNIDNIYETLIKNHAHDGIYGCSLDSVHRAIDSRLDKCDCLIKALMLRIPPAAAWKGLFSLVL